jgi:hypothetical protein
VGQGVLVVLGNARFNAGFIFKGIVVVVGELTVNGGTNVYGAMVALGDVTLQDKSTADAGAEETVFNGQSLGEVRPLPAQQRHRRHQQGDGPDGAAGGGRQHLRLVRVGPLTRGKGGGAPLA